MQGPPTPWNTGRCPSVSVKPYGDATVAVCAYDFSFGYGIKCCVGKVTDKFAGVMEWGVPAACSDWGYDPGVSLLRVNGKLYVIEANSSKSIFITKFQYRVGEVDDFNKTITRGTPDKSKGFHPKISTKDDGTVMAVAEKGHSSDSNHGKINLENNKVAWKATFEIPKFCGVKPDISINANKIVVACRSGMIIRFKVGTFDENIIWGDINVPHLSNGRNPSISINSTGDIMEVHQTWAGRMLSRCCGHVGDDYMINWGESKIHDYGEYPSISLCDDGFLYEVHKTHFGRQLFIVPGRMSTPNVSLNGIIC